MPSLSALGPRSRLAALTLILALGSMTLGSSASAQYMYLDSNGDGVNTEADVVNMTGPTSVDIYVVTDQNRDGSSPACPVDRPFTINSYTFVLHANAGTVSWDSFTNRQSTMTVSFGFSSNSTDLYRGYGGGTALPAGTYHLATVNLSVVSGTPALAIVAHGSGLSGYTLTSFGSACNGIDGDNTLKLGSDWFDTDGLTFGATTPVNNPPVLAPLSDMTALSGEVTSQPVTATDPDAQFITIEKGSGPSYMSLLDGVSERGSSSATIRLAPLSTDVGSAVGSVRATDGEVTDERSFGIIVLRSQEHSTEIEKVPDLALLAGTALRALLYATDVDGSALRFDKVSGPGWVRVASLTQGPVAATGEITMAPTTCDVGLAQVRIAVEGGANLVTDEFQVEVRMPPEPPSQSGGVASVGSGPVHVAVGDFNQDGHPDVVTANHNANTISVVLGKGDGTLGSRIDYPVGRGPWYVTVGDWNRDGHKDLAVANIFSNDLSILAGVGDGSFLPAFSLATRAWPNSATAADLNKDGNADLVVANGSDSYLSVFLGGAGGVFQPRQDFPAVGGIYGSAVGDFNRDGRLDVVSANWVAHGISFFPGFGDGTFAPRTDISLPVSPFSIAAGDFDADGLLDIAVPGYDTVVPILLGNGDGTFRPAAPLNASGGALYAIARDFDGDGRTDLAVGGDGESEFFQNLGGGAFSAGRWLEFPAYSLDVADMDGDGRLDVVSVDNSASVAVSLNVGGIQSAPEGRAFIQGDKRTTVGTGNSGPVIVRLEPFDASYLSADVAYGTLEMISSGTGSVDRIGVVTGKNLHTGDFDRNGVEELALQFAAEDIAALFENVGKRETVVVRIEGSLTTGRRLCAPLRLTVSGRGRPLATRVTPNPLNPSGVLAFRTSRDGFVRVRMFDLSGRLVRVLADVPLAPAGDQEIRIDGRGGHGETLATGAYFYVVETPEGKTRGRIMILK